MTLDGPGVLGLTELQKEREKSPELAEFIDLRLELLETEAPVLEAPPTHKEDAQALLAEGIPLLEGLEYEEALLASSQFAQYLRRISEVIGRHRPELADRLAQLADSGSPGEVVPQASEDEEIFAFLMRWAMRPFLLREAQRLAELVQDVEWYQSRCPMCGGEPDLAYLEPERGARQLACGRCDTVWEFARTGCPFCRADEPKSWGYYASGARRLYCCEECGRYLKTLDLRSGRRERLPEVERVLTVDMDLAAQEEGYK